MTSNQTTLGPARPAGNPNLATTTRPTPGAAFARSRRRWSLAAMRSDPLVLLAVALGLSVLAVDLLEPPPDARPSLALAVGFVGLQTLLSRVRGLPRVLPLARFCLSIAFLVAASLAIDANRGWPLLAMGVPVIALAAAFGREAFWVAVVTIVAMVVPIVLPSTADDTRRRLIGLVMASLVTAVGSRWVVTSLERSRDRLRRAQTLQRRRARQLGTVESVGRILARDGATAAALDAVVGTLDDTFGYRYPSIYIWDGHALRLGAHRNYTAPIESFPTDKGIIGRVARTRQAVFLPDVSGDPDYVAADPTVLGEISLPLLANGDLLGVLNVEMPGPRRLDTEDFATLEIVADRVAASLALGRERQRLTERAALMDRLMVFSRSLGRTLDPTTLHDEIAAGARRVIAADMAILVLRDADTNDFRTVQVDGGDPTLIGVRILPGQGITGRALRDATVVADDRLERAAFPPGAIRARVTDSLVAMSAPFVTGVTVVGALSWFREDLGRPFTDQEREIAGLLASQVALALSNAELHHATEVAAVTDPLTGLHNRRHFDATIARAEAIRRREPEADRRPRSAIMFDLDHFGRVNKLYGHQVGDRILRAFADVIRARLRASDLVARYGGEEFVAILEGASLAETVRLAEEIRESFGGVRFALPDGSAIGCTVSAGCSALAPSEAAPSMLLERADVGLAMAKAAGRDRVVAA